MEAFYVKSIAKAYNVLDAPISAVLDLQCTGYIIQKLVTKMLSSMRLDLTGLPLLWSRNSSVKMGISNIPGSFSSSSSAPELSFSTVSTETNQSTNQSINQSIHPSIHQSIHPSNNQSEQINQSINPSIHPTTIQINQSINPLTNQINQSIKSNIAGLFYSTLELSSSSFSTENKFI